MYTQQLDCNQHDYYLDQGNFNSVLCVRFPYNKIIFCCDLRHKIFIGVI